MKRTLDISFLLISLLTWQYANGQGWVAKIDLNLNHDHYAYEAIHNARLTFSGITVSGRSETRDLSFVISGEDPLSGEISLVVDGLAWERYDRGDPSSTPLAASYSGNYNTPCVTGFMEAEGQTPEEHIYIWVRIFPRMEISSFAQHCGELTLTSNTCSSSYAWEVSDNIFDGFKAIPGKSTPTITITHDELQALGFTTVYGRKYFRVTGLPNTTSQLQPVDIYYPGSSASLAAKDPKCHAGADGSVEVDITSALPSVIDDFVVTLFRATSGDPLAQEYIANANIITFSSLKPGGYNVRIENNTAINTYGNCWTEMFFELIDPDPVIVASAEITDFNGYQVTCAGSKDGAIRLNPSGGTRTFREYEWMPTVSSTSSAEKLGKGDYKVRVKDSNGCWSNQYSYSIKEPEKIAVDLLSTGGKGGFDVSCHDSTDGSIRVEVSGGVPAYDYVWADGPSTASRTGLKPGPYAVVVTDANGCTVQETIVLLAPDSITFPIEEVSGITCRGDRSGALAIGSVDNAIGEISILWSSGETSSQISGKPAGVYTVTVSDQQGCSATTGHELAEAPGFSLKVDITTDYHGYPISCHGGENGSATAHLLDENNHPVLGDRYVWFQNDVEFLSGSVDTTAAGLKAGLYKAEVTYRTFCKAEATVLLREPEPVDIVISNVSNYNGMLISCADARDGHIRAIANGGTGSPYTYSWNTSYEGPDLENIGAGSYEVSVRDANGCEASAQTTVIDPDPINARITILSDPSCSGSSDGRLKAVADGGTAPYTYNWSTGENRQAISDIPAGEYGVIITDSNGCSKSADTTLTQPTPVIAVIAERSDFSGYGVSCKGASDGYLLADASGGTGTYTYLWDGGDDGQTLHERLSAGAYSLTVFDQNGCVDSLATVITEPEKLTLNIPAFINVSCHNGADGEVTLIATGGAGNYNYSLSDSWDPKPVIGSLRAGTYTASVKDGNGCTTSIQHSVSEPLPLKITFRDMEPALCGNPVGKVTSEIYGGTGAYELAWMDSASNFIGNQHSLTQIPAGIYTIKVQDENNCVAYESVGIGSADGPAADIVDSSPASCSYAADGMAALEIFGNGPFAVRWPDGNTETVATNLRKGNYLVHVADANGCATVAFVTVNAPDSLLVEIVESSLPLCYGDCNGKLSVTAKGGNGNFQYKWHNSDGPTLDNVCAGAYTVIVSDQKQCIATATIGLPQPEPIALGWEKLKPPTCPGQCDGIIEINASGGTGVLDYQWSTGAIGPSITGVCEGLYVLNVLDRNHCGLSSSYIVEDPEGPSLELGDPVMLCTGQTYALDAGPGWDAYSWSTSDGPITAGRIITLSQAGTYWLETKDRMGCVARDTFLIRTSDDLLNANFLLTSTASVMDTIVAIDITWPLPESAQWTFPREMTRLIDRGDIVHGKFSQAGTYEVKLSARLGECADEATKIVVITDAAENESAGRLGSEPFVKSFTIHPNPNNGSFELTVAFARESPIVVTIFDVLTSSTIARMEAHGKSTYAERIDLGPLSSGSYMVRIEHLKGAVFKRMIVR